MLTTLQAGSASNPAVKPASGPRLVLSCVTIAAACSLFTSSAAAQGASQPSSSAIVSSNSEAKPDAPIEPRKPSIAEESAESDDSSIAVDPSSLLPELPPVPKANATLIGGTVDKLDLVRDRL